VSIDLNGSPLCGGIIVTSRHVFTAAHCVTDKNGGPDAEPGDVQVRVGTVVVTQGDVYNVSRILVHPKFQKAGRHFCFSSNFKTYVDLLVNTGNWKEKLQGPWSFFLFDKAKK
jgi:hypothetical protein